MLVVWMLSLSATGMPCSGPRTRAGRALAIERVGLLERARVDRERRVQAVFVEREPHEVLLNELM